MNLQLPYAHDYPWLRILIGFIVGMPVMYYLTAQYPTLFLLDFSHVPKGLLSAFRLYWFMPWSIIIPVGTALWLIHRRAARNRSGIAHTFLAAFILSFTAELFRDWRLLVQMAGDVRFGHYLTGAFQYGYQALQNTAMITTICWLLLPQDDSATAADYPTLKVITGFTLLLGLLTGCLFFLQVLLFRGSAAGIANLPGNVRLYLIPALLLGNWIAWRSLHCNARDIRRLLLVASVPLTFYYAFNSINNVYLVGNIPYAAAAIFLICLRFTLALLILAPVLLPKDETSPQDGKGYALFFAGMAGYGAALLAVLIIAAYLCLYLLVRIS